MRTLLSADAIFNKIINFFLSLCPSPRYEYTDNKISRFLYALQYSRTRTYICLFIRARMELAHLNRGWSACESCARDIYARGRADCMESRGRTRAVLLPAYKKKKFPPGVV